MQVMAKNLALNNDRERLPNTRVQEVLIAEAARPTAHGRLSKQSNKDCTALLHSARSTDPFVLH